MPKGFHSNQPKASDQHRWKAGSQVGSTGHVKVRVGKGHPLADPNGYAYEHLVVWVSAGNPRPAKGEILHHINEDKTDNRLKNLQLMTRSEHSQMHNDAMPDFWVVTIRECYASGAWSMKALAEHFECSIQRVSKIVRGETRLTAGGPVTVSKKAAGRANSLGAILDAQPFTRAYLMRWKLDFTGEGSPPQRNAWFIWDRDDQRATDGSRAHPEFCWLDRTDARQGVML